MKSKRMVFVIAVAVFLLFSTNLFAYGIIRDTTIKAVTQDEFGIHITYDSLLGFDITKSVNAPGVEKQILAIALTAQTSGLNVDIEVDLGKVIGITIKSP